LSAVRLEGIAKSYGGVDAVKDVSLSVESGEFVTFLGPSGCGKTTTLRIIAGFVRPTRGRVSIAETDVTEVPPHLRQVGLVFQNYALFPHMTVAQNVAFGLRMRKVAEPERTQRVREALDLVRLGEFGARSPRQLSGGQQQRVALARALVIRPSVLLLDEPFGALDRQLRDHMRVELRALQQRLGISTVFVTHDQDEALSMSDRIVVMNGGRVEQIGVPAEVYEHPRTRFVATFMGRSNVLAAEVVASDPSGTRIRIGRLDLLAPPSGLAAGASVTALVRPERIALSVQATGGIAGRIAAISYLGASFEAEVDADGTTILVSVPNAERVVGAPPRVGDAVSITIPQSAITLGS
jgi:spermidine/putrescine ABC transporter ATP-binding subunit